MAGSPNVDPEAVERLLIEKRIDGVFLTGGGDVYPTLYGGEIDNTMLVHRLRDDFEIELVRAAAKRHLPIRRIYRTCSQGAYARSARASARRGNDKIAGAH